MQVHQETNSPALSGWRELDDGGTSYGRETAGRFSDALLAGEVEPRVRTNG